MIQSIGYTTFAIKSGADSIQEELGSISQINQFYEETLTSVANPFCTKLVNEAAIESTEASRRQSPRRTQPVPKQAFDSQEHLDVWYRPGHFHLPVGGRLSPISGTVLLRILGRLHKYPRGSRRFRTTFQPDPGDFGPDRFLDNPFRYRYLHGYTPSILGLFR